MLDKGQPFTVLSFMYLTSAKRQNHLISLQKLTDMKKIFLLSLIILASLVTIMVGCNKDIEGRTDSAGALTPANIDLNAGAWKPILLTTADEFAVPAPSATNTPDY